MRITYQAGEDFKQNDFLKVADGKLYRTTMNARWDFIAPSDCEIGEEIEIEVDGESEQAKSLG